MLGIRTLSCGASSYQPGPTKDHQKGISPCDHDVTNSPLGTGFCTDDSESTKVFSRDASIPETGARERDKFIGDTRMMLI